MSEYLRPTEIKKKFWTPGVFVLCLLALNGLVFLALRFWFGIGSVTNLNDQYPWGIWIGIDVAAGVALAAGGFTTAALGHIMGREHFHSIVRPALLTAMLGYTFVAIGVFVDIGRWYYIWHPMFMWNGNSALFEVGICVMMYAAVLYIEFLPIIVERFIGRVNFKGALSFLDKPAEKFLKILDKGLSKTIFVFIILGVVLSTLHQSSLGTLMVIAGPKMHPLWQTPVLPMLFLLSAIAVGFPMVIFESMIASKSLGLKREMEVLTGLGFLVAPVLGIYFAFKIGDMFIRETFVYLTELNAASILFTVEVVVGVIIPLRMFLSKKVLEKPPLLFTAASLVIFGVLLNRINNFITAYTPPFSYGTYFPSIGEISVTVGFISMLMLLYRVIVLNFPVISLPDRTRAVKAKYVVSSVSAGGNGEPETRKTAGQTFLSVIFVMFLLTWSTVSAAQTKNQLALNCKSCHTIDVPTKQNPGLVPCPRTEMVNVHRSPEKGPDVVKLNQLARKYLPVEFSHRQHAQMLSSFGTEGCAGCHHFNTIGPIKACSECHSIERKREDISKPDLQAAYHRQCISCHKEWGGSDKCTSCHATENNSLNRPSVRGNEHPTIEQPEKLVYETSYDKGKLVTFYHNEHVELFKVECANCHKNEGCGRCHGPNNVSTTHERERPAVRGFAWRHRRGLTDNEAVKHERCFPCHEKDLCGRCHLDREAGPFNHKTSTGWDLDKYHKDLKCISCHPENEFVKQSGDCLSCHKNFDHKTRTGWALGKYHSKLECIRCHPGNKFVKRSTDCASCHKNFVKGSFNHSVTGVNLDETHLELECSNCHKDNNFSVKPGCNECHEDKGYPKDKPGK
jgi:Ni/Fe-hydrogenase subunit HybB-like protein